METWGEKKGRGIQLLKRLAIKHFKNYHNIKVDGSEGNESPVANFRRMMIKNVRGA
jgi:hypothetical protein